MKTTYTYKAIELKGRTLYFDGQGNSETRELLVTAFYYEKGPEEMKAALRKFCKANNYSVVNFPYGIGFTI